MNASRPLPELLCPTQADLDWLMTAGIHILSIATPEPMQITSGHRAADGLFEPDPAGARWCVFPMPVTADFVFWQPRSGELASWSGHVFALGQEIIGDAGTYALNHKLNIFLDPLDWLRGRRDGIVVLPGQWPRAFDWLRDAPRIAIAEQLLPIYRKHMRPGRMPELFVTRDARRLAA